MFYNSLDLSESFNHDHLYNYFFNFNSVVQFNDNQVTSDLLNTKESILSVCDELVTKAKKEITTVMEGD